MKIPLQTHCEWRLAQTVKEAVATVAKWPKWKRERILFSNKGEEKQ